MLGSGKETLRAASTCAELAMCIGAAGGDTLGGLVVGLLLGLSCWRVICDETGGVVLNQSLYSDRLEQLVVGPVQAPSEVMHQV